MNKKLEMAVWSVFAIIVGAVIIGCEYGAATGWGVGLIAYGLREIT